MADARNSRASRMAVSKGKRGHDSDPSEGTSGYHHCPKAPRPHDPPAHLKPSKLSTSAKDEERRHKAMEHAFQKAKKVASTKSASTPTTASTPPIPPALVAQAQTPEEPALSPDVSILGEATNPAEASSVFPSAIPDAPPPSSSRQSSPRDVRADTLAPSASDLREGEEHMLQIPPALATLISESIRQGIAQGLQQRTLSDVSGYVSRHSQSPCSQPQGDCRCLQACCFSRQ